MNADSAWLQPLCLATVCLKSEAQDSRRPSSVALTDGQTLQQTVSLTDSQTDRAAAARHIGALPP